MKRREKLYIKTVFNLTMLNFSRSLLHLPVTILFYIFYTISCSRMNEKEIGRCTSGNSFLDSMSTPMSDQRSALALNSDEAVDTCPRMCVCARARVCVQK